MILHINTPSRLLTEVTASMFGLNGVDCDAIDVDERLDNIVLREVDCSKSEDRSPPNGIETVGGRAASLPVIYSTRTLAMNRL